MSALLVSLLAAAIAFLGVCIAWGQWHTARQKLVLELFEKRYDRYRDFRDAYGNHEREGPDNEAAWWNLVRATYELEYLVGDDVLKTLEIIRSSGLKVRQLRRTMALNRPRTDEERGRLAAELEENWNRFDQSSRDLYDKLMPYLRMDQKLPRSPRQWLIDKWRNRPDGTE